MANCTVLLKKPYLIQAQRGWADDACIHGLTFGCNPEMPGRMWVSYACRGQFKVSQLINDIKRTRDVTCGMGPGLDGALMWCPPVSPVEVPASMGVAACAQPSGEGDTSTGAGPTPAVALVLSAASMFALRPLIQRTISVRVQFTFSLCII